MNRIVILICLAFPVIFQGSALAVTYSWIDSEGTVNFTEDPGSVPLKYRKKVRRLDDASTAAAQTSQQAPKSEQHQPDNANQTATKSQADSSQLYAGKTFEQWKKELSDKESEMNSLNKRTSDMVVIINNTKNREERDKLMGEYKSMTARFKELKAQYTQIVDAARRAGLTVNIKE